MRVNEIFYSLQGEGYHAGTPAVFIRFSGCNLKCGFCDTKHDAFKEMTEDDIIREACVYPATHVVITGGEPALQITASLVDKLHEKGKYVQIETNGTCRLPEHCRADWVTCSPKYRPVVISHIDELKVIYQTTEQDMSQYDNLVASVYSLQPCDFNDENLNAVTLKNAVDYCLANPKWRLSLQTHKIIHMR